MAPGRINIIGEHTDYAGGLCLPAAVDRYLAVAVSPADAVEVASESHPGPVTVATGTLAPTGGWADHVIGMLAETTAAGLHTGGARVAIVADLPEGAGLSSSAAVAVATGKALADMAGRDVGQFELARLSRRSENNFLGVPSGLMDQVACVMGRCDTALLFNAGTEIAELVPLQGRFGWLVCESGVDRTLRESDYGKRPAEAAEALRLAQTRHVGLRSLADLEAAEVEALGLPDPLGRRARHIAGESLRVRLAVACLEAGNVDALGQLMTTSHRSLARDAEVSTPELDALVEAALAGGCAGARLLGAGFGGSVIAVARDDAIDAAAMSILDSYRTPAGTRPRVHRLELVDGLMP